MSVELIRRGQSSVYGQVSDVVVKGNTYTNFVKDGILFGITDWYRYLCNVSVSDGIATLTQKANGSSEIELRQDYGSFAEGDKIYVSFFGRRNSESCTSIGCPYGDVDVYMGTSGSTITPEIDTWGKFSGLLTLPSDVSNLRLRFRGAMNVGTSLAGDSISIQKPFVINLTTTFGAGKEPTKEQCDQIFTNYFDGTKSTNSVRVVSTGKNLIIKDPNAWKVGTIAGLKGTNSSSTSRLRCKGFFKLKQDTNYTIKVNNNDFRTGYYLYDSNYNFIKAKYGKQEYSFNSGQGCFLRTIIRYSNDRTIDITDLLIANIQLEEGSTATTYEPYKESLAYLNAGGELRSLPNGVKDEVNVSTGTKTKNVSRDYIIKSNDIITTLDRENYTQAIMYFSVLPLPPINGLDTYQGTFKIVGWQETPFAIDGSYIANTFSTRSINSLSFNLPLGTTLAQARTLLTGQSLNYQLAEPVVTQLDPQPLTIFPNGTQYIEFGTKEVAEYADGINISNAEIPIKAMKTVDKLHIEDGHWKRTAIDLANVAVSPDGLSFTIADAVNGETYEYSYDYDSALSTLPDLDVGEPSLVTRNNRTIVL